MTGIEAVNELLMVGIPFDVACTETEVHLSPDALSWLVLWARDNPAQSAGLGDRLREGGR